MKRAIVAFLSIALMFAVTRPATADVFVFADIFKFKDVFVTELILKEKFVFVTVTFDETATGAAEAMAINNQRNQDNESTFAQPDPTLRQGPIDPEDMRIRKFALIEDSVSDNTGIVGLNQDVGNMVNQANVVALAVSNALSSVTNSQAETSQFNTDNFSWHQETSLFNQDDIPGSTNLRADIIDSVNNNAGIIQVNQNAGNMNNQSNNLAMAVGFGSILALSEAALGQFNTGNQVIEVQTVKFDLIDGSINGNTGVVAVNQSVGNMNNQASALSIAARTSTVSLTVPFQ